MEKETFDIFKYGDKVLTSQAIEIKNINENLINLNKNMIKKMYFSNGIGLAAPQIGKLIQLVVIDLTVGEDPTEVLTLINPQILESLGKETDNEGCLSFPGITLDINRKTKILLKAIDINGKEINREFENFKARVIQHEIDHLKGVLIIDRVSSLKKELTKKKIKKLKLNGEW